MKYLINPIQKLEVAEENTVIPTYPSICDIGPYNGTPPLPWSPQPI